LLDPDSLSEMGKSFSGDGDCLRVKVKSKQSAIRVTGLQDSLGVSATAKRAIYVETSALGLQRVYNVMVKYW
jgi:hypothetical protein